MGKKIIKISSRFLFFTIFSGVALFALGQDHKTIKITLSWEKPHISVRSDGAQRTWLYFKNAFPSEEFTTLPMYGTSFSGKEILKAELSDETYQDFPEQDLIPADFQYTKPEIKIVNGKASRKTISGVSFIPIIRQSGDSRAVRLVSFTLTIYFTEDRTRKTMVKSYKDHSEFASGKWYKLGTLSSGMYKVTFNDLVNLGVDVTSTPSSRYKIFGINGGMLPQENSAFRYDDIFECAISVKDGGNDKVEPGEYLLFYADAPFSYIPDFSKKIFTLQPNTYSDSLFYFLTPDGGKGKRISPTLLTNDQPTRVFNKFNAVLSRNDDKYNLIKSGRDWFGENFDFVTERSYAFDLKGISAGQTCKVTGRVIGRSDMQSNFEMQLNGAPLGLLPCNAVKLNDYDGTYATSALNTFSFNSSNLSSTLATITFRYDKPLSTSNGWVDYTVINYIRNLQLNTPQMEFATLDNIGKDSVSEYNLSGMNERTTVWDVTNVMEPTSVTIPLSDGKGMFRIKTDTLRKFVAFDPQQLSSPILLGNVPNQDLHGLEPPDLLIIAPAEFIQKDNPESPAVKFATYKRNKDGFTVETITPRIIYNEFSSGRVDISAIRDFIKMLYDKSDPSAEHHLQFVLLMGDASYDYKNKISGNINFIPTYEAYNSLDHIGSFASDDFYGFLDVNEGRWKEGGSGADVHFLDVAIGRFPVRNYSEAQGAITKVIRYTSDPLSKGSWRKKMMFIADDDDSGIHQDQADKLAEKIVWEDPEFEAIKLYLAAYPQTAAGGKTGRAPLMNEDILKNLIQGVLVFNYTGHGGETGFAHERILETTDVLALKNKYKLPFFITASCELSRFDDPDRVSVGEWIFLNKDGGGIGLASTTRVVFSGENSTLNIMLIDSLMYNEKGVYNKIGNIFKATKNELWSNNSGIMNNRNFTLLGDPSMSLNYPDGKVRINRIYRNGDTAKTSDTLKALCLITMEGEVLTKEDNPLLNFSGILSAEIFEKRTVIPMQPDQGVKSIDSAQSNVIYRGINTVTKGKFQFSFMVPKDISYKIGRGKVSMYASNDTFDASGYRYVQIGGSCSEIEEDGEGPIIKLFMNDETFIKGGITGCTPDVLAILYDKSGVNRVGLGIGHEIALFIDGDINHPKILNDYYVSKQDDYQNGEVRYKIQNLSPGPHKIKIRVWDVHNNPAEAETEFIVSCSGEIQLQHVYNYPNPFSSLTQFMFEHNHYGDDIEVQIDIFTVSGIRVQTITRTIFQSPSHVKDIYWNGTDEVGDKLARGLYFYRLRVKLLFDGSEESRFQKLVILR